MPESALVSLNGPAIFSPGFIYRQDGTNELSVLLLYAVSWKMSITF